MTSEEIKVLCELDRDGFIPGPEESLPEFMLRVGATKERHRLFDEQLDAAGEAVVFDLFTVKSSDRISPELIADALDITEKLYGFRITHVPGFYLTRKVGLLWGGCMLSDPEEMFSVFLLRNAFKKRRRFLNYRREELLAHELCHSARQYLSEITLEEYFAYQTSDRPLRRYLGNCFIRERDALCFLLPTLLLPVAGLLKAFCLPLLPLWPFWVLAALYPAFLLWRNQNSRNRVMRARKALLSCDIKNADAILFRCKIDEMDELSKFTNDIAGIQKYATTLAETSPRWSVILHRFILPENMQQQNSDEELI